MLNPKNHAILVPDAMIWVVYEVDYQALCFITYCSVL